MRRYVFALVSVAGVGCQPDSPPAASGPPAPQPVRAAGLHNVFRLSGGVYSGSSPAGDVGLASLRELGILTVVSVDGAAPDAAAAARHGLRYVHVPVGYDGIPRDKALTIARAVRDLPGPVYVHCHHGKHRGPAAAAAVMLCLEPAWDAARATDWLRTAGTDPRYAGLTDVPNSLGKPTAADLDAIPPVFPPVADVPDLARVMVAVDGRWDRLKAAKAAGWSAPQADPPHDALQLAEHYREAARSPDGVRRGPVFLAHLRGAEAAASELEEALRAKPPDRPVVDAAFARSAAACSTCHQQFRDRPAGR